MISLLTVIKKRAEIMSKRYRGKNRKNKAKVKAMAKISEPEKTAVAKATTKVTTAVANNYRPNKTKNDARKSVQEVKNINISGESIAPLYEILSTMRPAGTETEKKMIRKFIDPLGAKIDDYGNRIVQIPLADGTPSKTLFSCHTDTVHSKEGTQKLFLDLAAQEIFVDDSDCLGADDGTGIYIMIRMITAKVPGTYIFHREEEIGGKGSAHIKDKHGDWLKQFDRAIAFDRKGTEDIIIAQSAGIMASEKFSEELAKRLNTNGLKFTDSKGGTFTDTANYCRHIGECINLSVGYDRQHTSFETQSISFLQKLIPRLLLINWETLPTERKPGEPEPKYKNNYGWETDYGRNRAGGYNNQSYGRNNFRAERLTHQQIANIILNDPRVAMELLIAMKPTKEDLWDAEWENTSNQADYLNNFNNIYGGI